MNYEADALLPDSEVEEIVRVTPRSRARWVKAGSFPVPVKINGRNYWRKAEIDGWLAEKFAARAAA